MNDYNFTTSKIEELFQPLELFINSNPFLFNPTSIKEELINKVNLFVDELNQKIEQFQKEVKKDEDKKEEEKTDENKQKEDEKKEEIKMEENKKEEEKNKEEIKDEDKTV